MERNGGMDLSPEGEWRPVFPDPQPQHWLALVCYSQDDVGVLTDLFLSTRDREWLSNWISNHVSVDPEGEASYVYFGIGSADFRREPPDGTRNPLSITGVGSGQEVAEPPGAELSTIGRILALGIASLRAEI